MTDRTPQQHRDLAHRHLNSAYSNLVQASSASGQLIDSALGKVLMSALNFRTFGKSHETALRSAVDVLADEVQCLDLISSAAQAVEEIDPDELEQHAAKLGPHRLRAPSRDAPSVYCIACHGLFDNPVKQVACARCGAPAGHSAQRHD